MLCNSFIWNKTLFWRELIKTQKENKWKVLGSPWNWQNSLDSTLSELALIARNVKTLQDQWDCLERGPGQLDYLEKTLFHI